uniref:Uncharacterized protein n=1 Tax=Nelumbo nucifera TaxID=4432 RepID=A0A822XG46_NELNU|nr:TPA_asm: hypothetical protein HUJ06_019534 [Nelumbo nucifera]
MNRRQLENYTSIPGLGMLHIHPCLVTPALAKPLARVLAGLVIHLNEQFRLLPIALASLTIALNLQGGSSKFS